MTCLVVEGIIAADETADDNEQDDDDEGNLDIILVFEIIELFRFELSV